MLVLHVELQRDDDAGQAYTRRWKTDVLVLNFRFTASQRSVVLLCIYAHTTKHTSTTDGKGLPVMYNNPGNRVLCFYTHAQKRMSWIKEKLMPALLQR